VQLTVATVHVGTTLASGKTPVRQLR